MARIQQLPPQVINKIAAGEVIERPASVIKELMENSVDALATRIDVEIVNGGMEMIRVVDNGEGVHPDDLLLTVASHATSKIRQADDLFHVQTMGFRGEALASISEVSHFTLRSRQEESDTGWELNVAAGEIGTPKACGCPVGTSIEVRDLFVNTPVRRKFLKTAGTELGYVCEQFTRIALANPRLHLVLRHNQRVVYELPACERLLERLKLFHGKELAEQLIWVEQELQGYRIWGYVAHPSQSKSSRKGQYLFLNGRWIQDRSLQHALTEAYRGLLMVGRQPIAFLFLEMPPDQVDVNVHPTKSEVRFRESQTLYRLLLSAIRTRFLSMNLESGLRLPEEGGGGGKPVAADPYRQTEIQHELADWAKSQLTVQREAIARQEVDWGTLEDLPARESEPETEWDEASPAPSPGVSMLVGRGPHFSTDGQGAVWQEVRRSSAIQVQETYLVTATEDGLAIIDQHALHERILYEQFRERVLAGSVESQRLLIPEPIELSPAEGAVLLDQGTMLARVGLELEDFGGNTVLLTQYPVMLARADRRQMVKDVADCLMNSGKTPTRRDLLDDLLNMMACKAAIKAGQRLTPEEIDSLLAQRHLVDDAHHCPHGRPTILNLTRHDLDRQFGRLG
ncbi:MAG: DNA mismatch repair endonuclease MutL [Planctomycetales bacterium]